MWLKTFKSEQFVVGKNHPRNLNNYIVLQALSKKNKLSDWVKEARFIEGLTYKRLNFLLIWVAAVIGGSLNSKSFSISILLISIGLVVSTVLAIGVRRAYAKASFLIAASIAYGYEPSKTTVNEFKRLEGNKMGKKYFLGWRQWFRITELSPFELIGRYLPFMLCMLLLIWLILVCFLFVGEACGSGVVKVSVSEPISITNESSNQIISNTSAFLRNHIAQQPLKRRCSRGR